mmetsp:Transcript_38347/g.43942  ORF Transcript_38347/g.43942 Transcript_38347/m.43942 type:complete len:99 (+) Transcript_38347:459-755(+)
MQKWVFRYNHLSAVLTVGILYAIVNFAYVKFTGNYVYDILLWDDSFSFILINGAMAMLFMVFSVLYAFTKINTDSCHHKQTTGAGYEMRPQYGDIRLL